MAPVDYTICGLALVIFAGWCFNWLLHIFAIVYGKWRLSHKLPPYVAEELPGVSILKPLVGVDPHLFENLETFFNMKFPQYELLFCIQDEMDAALMVVKSLMQKYPKVDAKVFLGGRKIGINPKINNMILGYEAAKHDFILISDSGLKMEEETLLDMMLCVTEKTGLVHQMPYICDRKGFSSHLEKVFFGTQHAKIYLVANGLGVNCTTGMSCLFRKDVLEEAGGMKFLGQYLAEDYILAQLFLDRGWQVRINSHTARQNSGMYGISQFHARLIRWTKLRISTVPTTIVFEPVSQCMVLGLMASWAASYLFDWSALVFFLVHILVWFLGDYILITIIQNGPLPFSKFEFVVGWLMNELVSPYLIIQAHLNPKVTWRSKRYRIRWGGVTEEITPAAAMGKDSFAHQY